VTEFLASYNKYEWLWKENPTKSLQDFEKKIPSLQDYENALKKFTQVEEEEINLIDPAKIIGALELKTDQLVKSLKSYAREWKAKYAENLHKKAKEDLD